MHTEDWAEGKARQLLNQHGQKLAAVRVAAHITLLAGTVWSLIAEPRHLWMWILAAYLAWHLNGSLKELIHWSDHPPSQFACHDDDCCHTQA